MTPEQLPPDEAARWMSVAARDLNAAKLLSAEEPFASVFHSQQAVEKAAKAFLASQNVPFRKTHDIQELGQQCAALNPSLAALLADADYLTDYAVVFRYLDAPSTPDQQEAEQALRTARQIYEQVASLLVR